MNYGPLHYRVAFDAPEYVADGSGGQTRTWAEMLTCAAGFRFLRGGETVQAARLDGRQPAVVTIRSSSDARQITTDWRMRDTRTGAVYNVRSIVPTDDRAFLELLCESGVAV